MSKLKDKIDSILETYGSDITVNTYTITRDRGEPIFTLASSRSIKAVKDLNFTDQITLGSSGRIPSASSDLIVKGAEVFDPEFDKIVFGSKTYNLTEVNPLELTNEVLANILTVALD